MVTLRRNPFRTIRNPFREEKKEFPEKFLEEVIPREKAEVPIVSEKVTAPYNEELTDRILGDMWEDELRSPEGMPPEKYEDLPENIKDSFLREGEYLDAFKLDGEKRYGIRGTPISGYRKVERRATEIADYPLFEIAGVPISASDIAAIGLIGYGAYEAGRAAFNSFLQMSLRRNLQSWAKSSGIEIPKETETAFVNTAMRNLDKRFLTKESLRTLFKPTTAGRVNPITAQQAYQEANAATAELVSTQAPIIIPRATQTGAMAYGGVPAIPPSLPIEPRNIDQMRAELEGLKATLETDPVAQAKFKIGKKTVDLTHFVSLRERTYPDYFTVKEAQALYPGHDFSDLTTKGRVPRDAALDELTKRFNMTPDEIAERVTQITREKARIKELEKDLKIAKETVPAEIAAKPLVEEPVKVVPLERRIEIQRLIAEPAKNLPKGVTKIALRKELTEINKTLLPQEKKLRQQIMANVKIRALPQSQYRKIFKEKGGSRQLSQVKLPELNRVLEAVKSARPVKIGGKNVIKLETENKIQSLKSSLVAEGYLTEDYFNEIVERLHLKATGYETRTKFITESEGKSLIRAMNDEAEIGYIKQLIDRDRGLEANPTIKTSVDEFQKRIDKEGKLYFEGKPADTSVLKDMRYFTDDLQVRTGKPFYHIWYLMNRAHLNNRIISNKLKRMQIESTPKFRSIIGNKSALKRVNDYIAAKNKWMDVKSPKDIKPEEVKLANALEDQLLSLVPDYRYQRFLEFYQETNGNVARITEMIPDAPKEDIKIAVDIYESQGAGRLKAYLDTRDWGVIESGFEPHFVVNPKLAMSRLKTSFATGRFKSRSGVEFYPADMNVIQRVDRYTQQMLNFNLRPFVRKLESIYQEAIPQLKNPSKVRESLSMSANEMLGYVERGGMLYNYIIRFAGQAYATVFGTMPVLPFRNLFQNLAFHPDKSALIDPRNRILSKEDMEFYHTNVSQMESIPRDLMLSEEKGIPVIERLNRLIYRLNIYGASDSKINRVHSFWASLNKAERALNGYKKDGNVGKFISSSGMAELTLNQQSDILKILSVDEARAIREIALEITNNVHFLYDRSQRAPIEMGGMGRVFGSLVIFPRSLMQRVIYQFKPLDPKSWAPASKKKRAFAVLFAMLWGSIAANYLFNKTTGRTDAPYNPLNILMWSPGGLAIGSVTAITDFIGDLSLSIMGDEDAKKRLPSSVERAGDTMVPLWKITMQCLEAALDKKYIDRLAVREIRAMLEKKMQELGFLDEAYEPNKVFYEAERSWEWKFKHAIFGTEPEPPDPITVAVESINEAQAKLGQFVLAEDSDDGYTYEMSDLAGDIRKAIGDIPPEDITVDKGFHQLVFLYLDGERYWDTYYYSKPASQRNEFREKNEEISIKTEAYLLLWGKLSVARNPYSLAVVRRIAEVYDIPEEAIPVLLKEEEIEKPMEKPEGEIRNPFRAEEGNIPQRAEVEELGEPSESEIQRLVSKYGFTRRRAQLLLGTLNRVDLKYQGRLVNTIDDLLQIVNDLSSRGLKPYEIVWELEKAAWDSDVSYPIPESEANSFREWNFTEQTEERIDELVNNYGFKDDEAINALNFAYYKNPHYKGQIYDTEEKIMSLIRKLADEGLVAHEIVWHLEEIFYGAKVRR